MLTRPLAAIDMLRKLFLVGVVLLVGRGSVAQLLAALLLSFGFFALQVKLNPYRHKPDNVLRAATEFHVFIIIMVALALGKTDLSRENITAEGYNVFLFVTVRQRAELDWRFTCAWHREWLATGRLMRSPGRRAPHG